MSSARLLTRITSERSSARRGQPPSAEAESGVIAVATSDLRDLLAALEGAAPSSPAAARMAGAVREALAANEELVMVLGTAGQAGEARERELRERLDALVEQMTPHVEPVSEAAAVLSQRNGRRRAELLAEFGALTGEQIAEERSRAQNRHALVARWRKEGWLFGVPHRGQMVYPAFQFDDDFQLRPVIAQVLARLPTDRMSPWEVALWWTAGNGWLEGRRPVDLLDDEPERLPEAAAKLAAPSPL